jgi:hypothetical protein
MRAAAPWGQQSALWTRPSPGWAGFRRCWSALARDLGHQLMAPVTNAALISFAALVSRLEYQWVDPETRGMRSSKASPSRSSRRAVRREHAIHTRLEAVASGRKLVVKTSALTSKSSRCDRSSASRRFKSHFASPCHRAQIPGTQVLAHANRSKCVPHRSLADCWIWSPDSPVCQRGGRLSQQSIRPTPCLAVVADHHYRDQELADTVLPGTTVPQIGSAPGTSWNVEPDSLVIQ